MIFITSPKILRDRKSAIARFLKVIRQAIDFIYEKPAEAKDIYNAFTNMDKADPLSNKITDATLPCFTYDFSMAYEYYDDLQIWLKKSGKINKIIDPKKYWTNELSQ